MTKPLPEILPCPDCGGVKLELRAGRVGSSFYFWVECIWCGDEYIGTRKSARAAINVWNRMERK